MFSLWYVEDSETKAVFIMGDITKRPQETEKCDLIKLLKEAFQYFWYVYPVIECKYSKPVRPWPQEILSLILISY